MPSHWTYDQCPPDDDLYQGDILKRTSGLEEILGQVHRYFLDPKFVSFVVVTQSCDLVCRGKLCKAEHINLAVVRELEPILPEIVGRIAGVGVPGVYRKAARLFALDLLKRVINQNELARGMFYLHPDGDVEIATPSVVLLRVSIAVRREHYNVLKKARCGRLDAEFRNKLGWLCGNLYSRIATPDWDEATNSDDGSSVQAEALLKALDAGGNENWVPESWIKATEKVGVSLDGLDRDRAVSLLKQHAPPAPIESAINCIQRAALRLTAVDRAKTVVSTLSGDSDFEPLIVAHVAAALDEASGLQNRATFETAIRSDPRILQLFPKVVFSAVRETLEDETRTLDQLEAKLLASTFPQASARTLRGEIKKILDSDWARLENSLNGIEQLTIFPQEVVTKIRAVVVNVPMPAEMAFIERLAKRLRNDDAFSGLLDGDSSPVFFDAD